MARRYVLRPLRRLAERGRRAARRQRPGPRSELLPSRAQQAIRRSRTHRRAVVSSSPAPPRRSPAASAPGRSDHGAPAAAAGPAGRSVEVARSTGARRRHRCRRRRRRAPAAGPAQRVARLEALVAHPTARAPDRRVGGAKRPEAAAHPEGTAYSVTGGRATSRWWPTPGAGRPRGWSSDPGSPKEVPRRAPPRGTCRSRHARRSAAWPTTCRTSPTSRRSATTGTSTSCSRRARGRGSASRRSSRDHVVRTLPHGRRRGRRRRGVRPHHEPPPGARTLAVGHRAAWPSARGPRACSTGPASTWPPSSVTWRRSGRRGRPAAVPRRAASTSSSSTGAGIAAEAAASRRAASSRCRPGRRESRVDGVERRGLGADGHEAAAACSCGRATAADAALVGRARRTGSPPRAPTFTLGPLVGRRASTTSASSRCRGRPRSPRPPPPGRDRGGGGPRARPIPDRAVAGKVLRADGRLESAGGTVFFDRSVALIAEGSPDVRGPWHEFTRPGLLGPGPPRRQRRALRRRCRRRPTSTGRAFLREWCAAAWAHGASVVYQPTVAAVRVAGDGGEPSTPLAVVGLAAGARPPARAARPSSATARGATCSPTTTSRRAADEPPPRARGAHPHAGRSTATAARRTSTTPSSSCSRAGWQRHLPRPGGARASPRSATRSGSGSWASPPTTASPAPSGCCARTTSTSPLIAFWEPPAELLPLLRAHAPHTRVVINSMDVHFLRDARRAFGRSAALDDALRRRRPPKELNTYDAADAVIAVSDKERDLLADFLGDRVASSPSRWPRTSTRSPYPARRAARACTSSGTSATCRTGRPSSTCATTCCRCSTRPCSPATRSRCSATGSTGSSSTSPDAAAGVELVGWVPSVQPYAERARLAVVPLLHGAGVKRKVIQSMMGGTPVVTTPVGAEGLDLVQGEHALIAADAADLAAGHHPPAHRRRPLAPARRRAAPTTSTHRHGIDLVERRFAEILDDGDGAAARSAAPARRRRASAPARLVERPAVRRRLQSIGRPGSVVLVATRVRGRRRRPRDAAVLALPAGARRRLGRLRARRRCRRRSTTSRRSGRRGAALLRAPALGVQLAAPLPRAVRAPRGDLPAGPPGRAPRRLGPRARPGRRRPARRHARRLGSRWSAPTPAHRTGPPPTCSRELAASSRAGRRADAGAPTPTPAADARAAPTRTTSSTCATTPSSPAASSTGSIATHGHARRRSAAARPTSTGPTAGPPITERHAGTVAREVDERDPAPGARRCGPVPAATVRSSLADNLARRPPATARRRPTPGAGVRAPDLGGRTPTAARSSTPRPEPRRAPRISVLIATYERPDAAAGVPGVVRQADPRPSRVRGGRGRRRLRRRRARPTCSRRSPTTSRWSGCGSRHAGRSAAKNHAVLLAAGPDRAVLRRRRPRRARLPRAPPRRPRRPPGRGGGDPRPHRLGPGARARRRSCTTSPTSTG